MSSLPDVATSSIDSAVVEALQAQAGVATLYVNSACALSAYLSATSATAHAFREQGDEKAGEDFTSFANCGANVLTDALLTATVGATHEILDVVRESAGARAAQEPPLKPLSFWEFMRCTRDDFSPDGAYTYLGLRMHKPVKGSGPLGLRLRGE